MKKTILFTLVSLSLTACSYDEFLPLENASVETQTFDCLRTETEAIEIATRGLNDFYPVKSRSARDLSEMNVVLLQSPVSRSVEDINPLYVVNFGNESGYAIVSASKDREPLLAVTESGSITSLDAIENPGLRLFVDGAMKLQKDTTALVPIPGSGDDSKVSIFWNDTIFHAQNSVEPRITVKWGQRYPEGQLCPNGLSGCTLTAAAQALSYFEYPEKITLTFPERTSNETPLDWADMKKIMSKNHPYRIESDYDVQLSLLCRELGHRIHAIYSEDKTSASLYRLRENLMILLSAKNFLFSNWENSIPETNKVLGNGILLMQGSRLKPKNPMDLTEGYEKVGHAWVIDGYHYKNYTVYVYCQEIDTPYVILERQFEKTELYSHVNWGWNGSDNGYFSNNGLGDYDRDFAYFVLNTK
ncbi:MAG: C10 family peptidase [Muribaculaceae bacterium]|nr:C10 family peptidase [Muribaculaceae bacterium]